MEGFLPAGNVSFPFSLVRGRRIRSREFAGEVGQRQAGGAAGQSRTLSLGSSGHLFSGSPSRVGAGALLSRCHCSWQEHELPALSGSLGSLHPSPEPVPLLRILKTPL